MKKLKDHFIEPIWVSLRKAGYFEEAKLVKAKILASQIKKREKS